MQGLLPGTCPMVANPFLRHAMAIAANIVFLVPIVRVFSSDALLRESLVFGINRILAIGNGNRLGFPVRFCVGAIHYQRGYRGKTSIEFLGGASD